ncbi:hypothetical protein DKT75_10680 [Leucothrix arctica]|uniref:Uncharacterized protein n=2 Tax=Leucothrix arctica TaxID=1481894 RepID=A0A317CBG4_9GAMM|nr:hypothetical protein DKT75_10680 [Leucothrix arctica]
MLATPLYNAARMQFWEPVEAKQTIWKNAFKSDNVPGSVGGQVGGQIELNKNASELATYAVKAVCVRKFYSGSGKSRSLKEDLVWEGNTFANYCSLGKVDCIEFGVDVL